MNDNNFYFGEITLYNANGREKLTYEWDVKFGELWDLEIKQNEKKLHTVDFAVLDNIEIEKKEIVKIKLDISETLKKFKNENIYKKQLV